MDARLIFVQAMPLGNAGSTAPQSAAVSMRAMRRSEKLRRPAATARASEASAGVAGNDRVELGHLVHGDQLQYVGARRAVGTAGECRDRLREIGAVAIAPARLAGSDVSTKA